MMKGTTQLAPGWQRIGKKYKLSPLRSLLLKRDYICSPFAFFPFVAQQISNFSVIKILIPENAQEM